MNSSIVALIAVLGAFIFADAKPFEPQTVSISGVKSLSSKVVNRSEKLLPIIPGPLSYVATRWFLRPGSLHYSGRGFSLIPFYPTRSAFSDNYVPFCLFR